MNLGLALWNIIAAALRILVEKPKELLLAPSETLSNHPIMMYTPTLLLFGHCFSSSRYQNDRSETKGSANSGLWQSPNGTLMIVCTAFSLCN